MSSTEGCFSRGGLGFESLLALPSAWPLCTPAFWIQSSAPLLCKSAIDQAGLGAFFPLSHFPAMF